MDDKQAMMGLTKIALAAVNLVAQLGNDCDEAARWDRGSVKTETVRDRLKEFHDRAYAKEER